MLAYIPYMDPMGYIISHESGIIYPSHGTFKPVLDSFR